MRDILRMRFEAGFWLPRFRNLEEFSARFWPPRFRNLGEISTGCWPPRFLIEISAGFWPPRFRNLGEISAAKILPRISPRSRRHLGENFGRDQPSLRHPRRYYTLIVYLSRYLYNLLCSKILSLKKPISRTGQWTEFVKHLRNKCFQPNNNHALTITCETRTKIKQDYNKLNRKKEKFGN